MSPDHEQRRNALREGAEKLLGADHFVALGIARTASPDEIKNAFVERAKTWHPDRVPQGMEELRPVFIKLFSRLERARATLSDPARRTRYIEELSTPAVAATAGDISSAEAKLEFQKAEALLKKNDVVVAERHLRRAVQLAPSIVEYQVLLVGLQAKPDASPSRLRELVGELDAIIVREPRAERAYFCRGQLRKRLDLSKEAHADFVRAAELNPKNVDAIREVRIYKMRQEKAASVAAPPKDTGAGDAVGRISGLFKDLFKR